MDRASKLDPYGGFTDVKGEKTGFFHAQKIGDRWWLLRREASEPVAPYERVAGS